MSMLFYGAVALFAMRCQQSIAQPGSRAKTPAEKVEAYLRSEMKERGIPGLQVAVVRHGRIVYQGAYGFANLQYSTPVTQTTVFPICSITKAITGVAAMQLTEDGRLDLSAPVSNYLDGLPAPWKPVTIRQLLTHMSGIPNIIDSSDKLIGDGEQDDAWARVQTLPMDFAPGERFDYNQTNYVLLGKIIDKLSGEPFVRFITERQLKIAGMKLTGFGDSRDVVKNKAQSYGYDYHSPNDAGKIRNSYENFTPFFRTASGINSTANDMARWIIALQGGELLKKKSSLQTLWTPVAFNSGQIGQWALGWGVPFNRPSHGAIGMTGGGRAAIFVYPDDDTGIVILTNLAGAWPEELVDPVARYFIPQMRLTGVAALRDALRNQDDKNAAEVAGELKKKDPSFQLPEMEANDWAYRLLSSGKGKRAVEIFKLIASLYPRSGNAYDSLADGYDLIGEKDLAIQNYKRSLELDPKNMNAVRRLKKLGVSIEGSP